MANSLRRTNFEAYVKAQGLRFLTLDVDANNQYKNQYTQAAYVIWNYKDHQLKKTRLELKGYKEIVDDYRQQLMQESMEDKAIKAAIKHALKTPQHQNNTEVKKPKTVLSRIFRLGGSHD